MPVGICGARMNKEKKGNGEFAVYRRILRIDELIASGCYPTIDDFIDDHEALGSRATIYRAIELMKLELNAPIERDPKSKGFYYTDRTYRLPTVFTTGQEMFAVAILQNMVSNLKGTPVYESAKKVLETIQKSTVKNPGLVKWNADNRFSESTDLEWTSNKYVFLDDCRIDISEKNWNIIGKALKENIIIKFDYSGIWKTEKTQRRVQPYQAVFSNGTWYLWCWDLPKKAFRLFQIPRMSNIKLTADKFIVPSDADFKMHSSGVFGAFMGETKKPVEFKAQFYDEACEFIRDRKWGDNQKIEEQEDGSIILSFRGNQLYPFLKLILGFGCNARPLAPKQLVDEWEIHVKEMVKNLK